MLWLQRRTNKRLWSWAGWRLCSHSCVPPTTGYASRLRARSSIWASTLSTSNGQETYPKRLLCYQRQANTGGKCMPKEQPKTYFEVHDTNLCFLPGLIYLHLAQTSFLYRPSPIYLLRVKLDAPFNHGKAERALLMLLVAFWHVLLSSCSQAMTRRLEHQQPGFEASWYGVAFPFQSIHESVLALCDGNTSAATLLPRRMTTS